MNLLMWLLELLRMAWDFLAHFDVYLNQWVTAAGLWIYVVAFMIILLETGVVLFPFLPGDSLLFALGAVAAANPESALQTQYLIPVLILAAILGGGLNYYIGDYLAPRVFKSETSLWFNRNHLLKTQEFYERHGGKTVMLARFIPILRTFAPFVAGMGKMESHRFHTFNVIGGFFWVFFMVGCGHFFGNIPIVKENFGAVIPAIIIISAIPILSEFFRKKFKKVKSV